MRPEHMPQVAPKSELTAVAPPKPKSKTIPIPPGSSKRQRWLREGSVVAVTPGPVICPVPRGACPCIRRSGTEALEDCLARLQLLLEALLAESCYACLLLLHLGLLSHNLLRLEALELLQLGLDGRSLCLQLLLLLD